METKTSRYRHQTGIVTATKIEVKFKKKNMQISKKWRWEYFILLFLFHVTPWNCVKVMKVTLDQTRTPTMAS
jgi:hypothetical protein